MEAPFAFQNLCYVLHMSWASNFTFTVDKPDEPKVVAPWVKVEAPAYQSDENLKKQYGIELAKASNPFEASCKVFGEDTGKALWAASNWIMDPVVLATRDAYLKTLELSQPPLDREQLAAKVLALAEGEKVLINGVMRPTIEAKDRHSFFKLYSEILGYTGKVEIDNSTKTINNTNNELKIVLVRATDTKPTILNEAPNVKSEIANVTGLPSPVIKLVKAG